jgi:peptidylprolyl isomerase
MPEWRTIAPENLLVIDSSKGRVLVELEPRAAPGHVERIRTLADSGFYDGLKFHRVIAGFMAQTGDPQGTGEGGSDLPNIPAELTFRRGRDSGFVPVANAGQGLRGLMGTLPVVTQPDAQMFVTADFKVDAGGLFCPGVAGMARASAMDSANSQFFLMMGLNANLNGAYTTFGRVVSGLDVIKALKAGPASTDGAVTDNADTMTRVRIAAALPEAERPTVRVMDPRAPAFAQLVETTRAAKGVGFNICDLQLPAEVTGG